MKATSWRLLFEFRPRLALQPHIRDCGGSLMGHALSAKAVVSTGCGEATVQQVDLPELDRGDVRVRTLVSGISTGTDKWVIQGRFVWVDITYPAVPGYQAVGVIEGVGADVEEFHVGQQVAVTRGREFGRVASAWGTHASVIVADRSEVYDATGIPRLRGAFLVVAQVGYNAASRLQLEKGSRVLVVGDGIIGASAALASVARGFDVRIMGRHDTRLAGLRGVGLATVDARSEAQRALAEFSPIAVIDTVQNDEASAVYIPVLPRATGQIVYSGHSPGGVTVWADMAVLQKRELTAHFVSGMTRPRLEATLEMMREGRLPTDRLAGTVADDQVSIDRVMAEVAAGRLEPVAAALDWDWAE